MTLEVFDSHRLSNAGQYEISDALEEGKIVYFPVSPVELPAPETLVFFREELSKLIKLKNISYHPESGRVRGLDTAGLLLAGKTLPSPRWLLRPEVVTMLWQSLKSSIFSK